MMSVIPRQRRLRAQIAVSARWPQPFAHEDQAAVARAAMRACFRHEADPDGIRLRARHAMSGDTLAEAMACAGQGCTSAERDRIATAESQAGA